MTDQNGKLVEGPVALLVDVNDQNDNRPIFKETRYAGEVLEGSPTGRWRYPLCLSMAVLTRVVLISANCKLH